jgi:hypothetical protein
MTTRLYKTILLTHRCLSIWCGSHTLTGGRIHNIKPKPKTKTPPRRILLSHIHTNGTQLQHLRMRTPGNHQSNITLEAIPNLDQGTLHHPYRPRKPTTLGITQETELSYSTMAWRTTGLQLQTSTRTRETSHHSQRPIITHGSR